MPASHGYASSQAGPSNHAKAQRLRVQPPPRGKGGQQQPQQPPPKSSLDLAWSYSRSQAHGPLDSSPSFTEKHWAGPHAQQDSEEDGDVDDGEEEEADNEEEGIEEDVDGDVTILEGVDAGPRVAHPQVRRLATEEERPVYSRGRSRDRSPKRLNASGVHSPGSFDRRGRRRSPRDGSSSLLLATAAAPGGMDSPRVGSHYERCSLRSSSRADESDSDGGGDDMHHRRRPRMRRHSSSYRSDGRAEEQQQQQQQQQQLRLDNESTPLLRRQRSTTRSQSMPLSSERPRTPRPTSMESNGNLRGQDDGDREGLGWLARLWAACFSCCAGRRA